VVDQDSEFGDVAVHQSAICVHVYHEFEHLHRADDGKKEGFSYISSAIQIGATGHADNVRDERDRRVIAHMRNTIEYILLLLLIKMGIGFSSFDDEDETNAVVATDAETADIDYSGSCVRCKLIRESLTKKRKLKILPPGILYK
jgi:hypothetical protein